MNLKQEQKTNPLATVLRFENVDVLNIDRFELMPSLDTFSQPLHLNPLLRPMCLKSTAS